MRTIDWSEVRDAVVGARVALRLEQQPSYAQTPEEREHFEAFLHGDRRAPTTVPNLARWYETVAGRPVGCRMERVRIHQDPPTDYQRWVRWIGEWNDRAGDVMHYTTPRQASAAGLDDAGPDDWWLLDDELLIRLTFDVPDVATLSASDDPGDIDRAHQWWRLALDAAT